VDGTENRHGIVADYLADPTSPPESMPG